MHTFDVRPPAFRSARNDETNFTSDKPPQRDEQFGEVMNRALAGNPREINREDAEPPPRDTHTAASQKNQAAKAKKPLPRDSSADNDATQAPIMANPNAQHLSHSTDSQTNSDDNDDDGSSHETSESDNDKGKPATASGKADDASKSTDAQLLTVAGALPGSAPVSTQVPTGGKAGKDAKGNSTGGLCADKQAEAPNASAAPSNSKSAETKDSADPDEKVLTASDTPAKDPPESKPSPDKGVPASALASAADPAGTSAAKQYLTMKKTDKMQKVAGPAEQDLPGDATKGSEELPMAQKISASALLHSHEKLDSAVTVDSQPATAVSSAPEPAAAASPTILPTAGVDNRLRVLERTHDIVALHAMRLNQTGSDSLHVVVKPGGGIQLSLELRQGEGFIEVSASLHKGDFAHLSQYWPELQQRLEARGVRVSDLACSENLSDTGHQEFQQPKQQQSPDQDPLHAGAFAEFALAGSLREAPATRAARATAYRGWESWA